MVANMAINHGLRTLPLVSRDILNSAPEVCRTTLSFAIIIWKVFIVVIKERRQDVVYSQVSCQLDL